MLWSSINLSKLCHCTAALLHHLSRAGSLETCNGVSNIAIVAHLLNVTIGMTGEVLDWGNCQLVNAALNTGCR